MEEINFNVKKGQRLIPGIQLAKTPSEVHVGWKGNQLRTNTITETWAGVREMFGELWMKYTLMTDLNRETDEEDLESQYLLAPTKKLCFEEGGSILNASTHNRKKESDSS